MPALITPFDASGAIDIGAHRHNVSVAVDAGAVGVLIAGSTGEGPYLEAGERATLVSGARDEHSDLTILCGISAETDRQAELQITEASTHGADAVLVVTPTTLVRHRDQSIVDFYCRIADRSLLPVLLYTVPRVTAYTLGVEAVRKLADHSNISGMKDSGGDPSRLEQLADVLGQDFVAYSGSSQALLASGASGAHGAITASANYAWKLADRAISMDQPAQSRLSSLTSAIEPHGVPGTKFAASLVGMHPGDARLPLQPTDERAESMIRGAVERFLPDA